MEDHLSIHRELVFEINRGVLGFGMLSDYPATESGWYKGPPVPTPPVRVIPIGVRLIHLGNGSRAPGMAHLLPMVRGTERRILLASTVVNHRLTESLLVQRGVVVWIPGWLALSSLGAVGVFFFCRARRLRLYYSRLANSRCTRCGYDLRATPDRCPECGAVP